MNFYNFIFHFHIVFFNFYNFYSYYKYKEMRNSSLIHSLIRHINNHNRYKNMITRIKIIEPYEIRIYETHSPITRSKHFYIFHCPISQIALSLVSNCTQYMFTLYKHVLTLLPRYYFQERCKNSWEEQKIPDRDQYLEFHEQE